MNNKECRKCGSGLVTVEYHSGTRDKGCKWNGGEHLHYTCQACGYDWIGKTKDSE